MNYIQLTNATLAKKNFCKNKKKADTVAAQRKKKKRKSVSHCLFAYLRSAKQVNTTHHIYKL